MINENRKGDAKGEKPKGCGEDRREMIKEGADGGHEEDGSEERWTGGGRRERETRKKTEKDGGKRGEVKKREGKRKRGVRGKQQELWATCYRFSL